MNRIGITSFFLSTLLILSCEKKDDASSDSNLPSKFKVDIPSSVSSSNSGSRIKKSDEIDGAVAYAAIPHYVALAEGAADVVEDLILAIRLYNLDNAQSFQYTSDDDGRTKSISVTENTDAFGQSWQYVLDLSDIDGSLGMRLAWNNNPIKGVALMSPYHINRTESSTLVNTLYQIEYDESLAENDAEMIVSIYNAPKITGDEGSIDNLKLKATKSGDIVEVLSTSNHPYLTFSESIDPGITYAFVARSDEQKNIGVIKAALPTNDVTTVDGIFEDYSIYETWVNLIALEYSLSESDTRAHLDTVMVNKEQPGYYSTDGFIGSGTAPSSDYSANGFNNLDDLVPYRPSEIDSLVLSF